MALEVRLVELVEVVRAQLAVQLPGLEHVVDDDEQGVGDRDQRLAVAMYLAWAVLFYDLLHRAGSNSRCGVRIDSQVSLACSSLSQETATISPPGRHPAASLTGGL